MKNSFAEIDLINEEQENFEKFIVKNIRTISIFHKKGLDITKKIKTFSFSFKIKFVDNISLM